MFPLPQHLRRLALSAFAAAVVPAGAHAGIALTPAQKTCIVETGAAIAEAKRAELAAQLAYATALAPDSKPLFDALQVVDLASLEVQRLQLTYLTEHFPAETPYDPAEVPVSSLQAAVDEPMLMALETDAVYTQAVAALADATYDADKLGGRERAGYVMAKAPPNPDQQAAALEAGNAYYALTEKMCGP